MNTFLTLLLAGVLFSFSYAQSDITEYPSRGGFSEQVSSPVSSDDSIEQRGLAKYSQAFIEQDREGLRKPFDPPVPSDRILEGYITTPIAIKSTPRYRINENIDKKLLRWVMNPDVDLSFSISRDQAAAWLSDYHKVNAELSGLDVLNISWTFPKEYYFYRTQQEINADLIHVRAWHPFRVDAEIKYQLNGQERTQRIEKWVTEKMLHEAYQSNS